MVFGNEHAGVSEDVLKHTDGNFVIPMSGMVESLNISVACAVSLFEAKRQRLSKGYYSDNPQMTAQQQETLLNDYIERHEARYKGRLAKE